MGQVEVEKTSAELLVAEEKALDQAFAMATSED
jgi:hypothetical protein